MYQHTGSINGLAHFAKVMSNSAHHTAMMAKPQASIERAMDYLARRSDDTMDTPGALSTLLMAHKQVLRQRQADREKVAK